MDLFINFSRVSFLYKWYVMAKYVVNTNSDIHPGRFEFLCGVDLFSFEMLPVTIRAACSIRKCK